MTEAEKQMVVTQAGHGLVSTACAISAAFIVLVVGPTSAVAAADGEDDTWQLQQASMTRVCHVLMKTVTPPLGNVLSKHPTRKAACKAAAARFDPDLSDTTKCWAYGQGTKDACKKEGVSLK